MRMRIVMGLTLAAALSGSAFAQTARPNMPSDFDVLQRKSIFNKDRRPSIRNADGSYGNQYTRPRTDQQPRQTRTPALRGILRQEDDYVALLEEPRSNQIVIIRKGDALPNDEGVVTDITLDDLGIAAAGDQPARRIKIGQNLHGVAAQTESPAPSSPPASPSNSSTGGSDTASTPPSTGDTASSGGTPAAGSAETPPSTGGTSLDDIKARMMAKRRQQNGGK